MLGNCPKDSAVAVRTMPSYLPVPASVSCTVLAPSKLFRVGYWSPSLSMASHSFKPVFLPSIELNMPTQRKVIMSKAPPGGLLRVVPVFSTLQALWVLENAMVLLTPDQQFVISYLPCFGRSAARAAPTPTRRRTATHHTVTYVCSILAIWSS